MNFSSYIYFLERIMVLIPSLYHQKLCIEIPINVNEDVLESMLKQAKRLRGHEYAVWRVQNGSPVQLSEHEYSAEHPTPHIIIQKLRCHEKEWNLCYWIPRHERRGQNYIMEENDFISATYTMALDQILNETSHYHYRRESKGLHFTRRRSVFQSCLEGEFRSHFEELSRKRQFLLLEEQSYILIRQGFPLTHTLGAENCAVIYSKDVFVFCGNRNISPRLKSAAQLLGHILKQEVQKFDSSAGYINIDYRNPGTSLQKLENTIQFFREVHIDATPLHLPILKSHGNQNGFIIKSYWRNQWIITFTRDTDAEVWYTSLKRGPLQKSMLKSDECHLVFFSEEYSEGFYLWIGTKSTIEYRMRASIKLEQAINRYYKSGWAYKSFTESVPEVIIEGKEPLEFKTIFMDWFDEDNLNFGYSMRDILNKKFKLSSY